MLLLLDSVQSCCWTTADSLPRRHLLRRARPWRDRCGPCLKRGLAIVVVGFPAVPLLMSRARFSISAGHTRESLDRALKEIEDIADIVKIRYDKTNPEYLATVSASP